MDFSKNNQIIYNEKMLRVECEPVSSLKEGQEISQHLFKILSKHKNGIGLSAIQVGIKKNVFVVNVNEPLYFVNAKIIAEKFPIIADEGCLSFPKVYIKTKRFAQIKVSADNINGVITFGYQGDLETDFKNNPNLKLDSKSLLECIAIQHEYSHTIGKLMFDYKFIQPNYTVKKINRNEQICVTDKSGNDILIKYKKAIPFLNSGEWVIKDIKKF